MTTLLFGFPIIPDFTNIMLLLRVCLFLLFGLIYFALVLTS